MITVFDHQVAFVYCTRVGAAFLQEVTFFRVLVNSHNTKANSATYRVNQKG